MTVEEYLNGEIKYDKRGQYIWLVDKRGHHDKIADLRGWGKIQNLFENKDKTIDFKSAELFQDEVGEFIVQAIREKLINDRK